MAALAAELRLSLTGAQVVEPATFARREEYIEKFYQLRQRKGITRRLFCANRGFPAHCQRHHDIGKHAVLQE